MGEAQALRLGGDPEASLQRLDTVLRTDPLHPEALEARGLALLELGREDEAASALQAALGNATLSVSIRARVLAWLGSALRVAGREADAEARLREALALDPAQEDACLSLGVLLAGQGRLAEACGAMLKAASLDRRPAPRLALALAVPAIIPSQADIPK